MNTKTTHFTQLPNTFIDNHVKNLTGSQIQIFLVVLRKTKGFHKDFDSISITQFQNITGLSNKSVAKSIKVLEEKDLIIVKRTKGKTNKYAVNYSQMNSENAAAYVENAGDNNSVHGNFTGKDVHRGCEKSSSNTAKAGVKSTHTKYNTQKKRVKENNAPPPFSPADSKSDEKYVYFKLNMMRQLINVFCREYENAKGIKYEWCENDKLALYRAGKIAAEEDDLERFDLEKYVKRVKTYLARENDYHVRRNWCFELFITRYNEYRFDENGEDIYKREERKRYEEMKRIVEHKYCFHGEEAMTEEELDFFINELDRIVL